MRINFRSPGTGVSRAMGVAGCVLTLSVVMLFAQAGGAPAAPQTAAQHFKNIQVLKEIPADQLIPTMQFVSASLGVECSFCHVDRAFDKDDKKPKQIARQMMTMQDGINKNSFKGEMEVTCNTCHRGSERPMGIPAIADANWKPEPPKPETAPPPPPPNADAVIAKYIDALGGASALDRVHSLTEKGSALVNGKSTPIDIYARTPDQRISFMHVGQGDSVTAFNGKAGWLANPGRPIHDMSTSEAAGARLTALFTFPATAVKEFTRLRAGRPDKIDDHSVTTVFAMREGLPPARLFFDDQTGLLVRMISYSETALGRMPTQVDYEDYRTVDGVKMPYRWTISRPGGRFTIQVDEVKPNAPIDDAKFVRPPDPPTPPNAPPSAH